MTISKVVFPVSDASRKLIMDVCKFLLSESQKRWPYDSKVKDRIDELLNYLPEVQFLGKRHQEVSIDGSHYEFLRKQPCRPLLDAVHAAEEFDSNECEVMLMRFRFRRKLEAGSCSEWYSIDVHP